MINTQFIGQIRFHRQVGRHGSADGYSIGFHWHYNLRIAWNAVYISVNKMVIINNIFIRGSSNSPLIKIQVVAASNSGMYQRFFLILKYIYFNNDVNTVFKISVNLWNDYYSVYAKNNYNSVYEPKSPESCIGKSLLEKWRV